MANKVEVIVGTYEEYLLGYKVGRSKDGKVALSQSFATRSHTGSVRCLAACGKYLASGGADDRIYLYDMLTRKESQVLIHHEGTVNTLAFTPDATHILSGGDDGKIGAVRTNTWQVEVVWKKAHSGSSITNISCHPSGKLALSLGNDLTLRTWNLIKGRLAYTTNLKSLVSLSRMADGVAWSPCGEYFTLLGARVVLVFGIKTAAVLKEQSLESKPTSICWLTKSKFLVGLEDGKLMLLNVRGEPEPVLFTAHKQRVKSIAYVNEILATASSSGDVALWTVSIKEKTIEQICSVNIGCRPTCLALVDLSQFDDDYILKKEDKKIEEVVEESTNGSKKSLETGSVVIEYDNDDLPISEVYKAMKDKNKISIKNRSTPQKCNQSEKQGKTKEVKWNETTFSQSSETSNDEPKWKKSNAKGNGISPMQQKQTEDFKVEVKSQESVNKKKNKEKQQKESQNTQNNFISQATEERIKNECKKVSVEIKRTKKTRGRNKINYVHPKQQKQVDKADSDISSSLDDFEMPTLKRELSNYDSNSAREDNSQGSPMKRILNSSKKGSSVKKRRREI